MSKRIICFHSHSDEEAKRRAIFEIKWHYKYGKNILTEYSRNIAEYYNGYELVKEVVIRMVFENTPEL